jgi:hypothetical protein
MPGAQHTHRRAGWRYLIGVGILLPAARPDLDQMPDVMVARGRSNQASAWLSPCFTTRQTDLTPSSMAG